MVKIRDMSNGECFQQFNVDTELSHISFGISNSYLYSELGTIEIENSSSSRLLQIVSEPQNPQYQGLGLILDRLWVTYNTENVVRMSLEYRVFCSTVLEGTIGIGTRTGRVWICKLVPDVSYGLG